MHEIVVDVFADDDSWWWEAPQLRLRRGPFDRQAEADSDAEQHAEALIATLAATRLRRR